MVENTPRLGPVDVEHLTEEQRHLYDAIATGPRGRVPAPLLLWLHSPQMAEPAQRLGAFVRYGTSLPRRLSELAILVTARVWRAEYEWCVHAAEAAKAGLDAHIIEAVRCGERPKSMQEDEAAVHDISHALHRDHAVDDALYIRAEAALGSKGLIELTGLLGYYTLISMTLNLFRVPVPRPQGCPPPFDTAP